MLRHRDNCQSGRQEEQQLLCIVWNAAESGLNRDGVTSLNRNREPLKKKLGFPGVKQR